MIRNFWFIFLYDLKFNKKFNNKVGSFLEGKFYVFFYFLRCKCVDFGFDE